MLIVRLTISQQSSASRIEFKTNFEFGNIYSREVEDNVIDLHVELHSVPSHKALRVNL